MPRVLRIFNRLILGGPAFNVSYLTKFLAPDFETKLVIGAKDDFEEEATFLKVDYDLQPYEIPSMKRSLNLVDDRKAYMALKKVIREFKPHIVHTHTSKPGALGRLAAYHCNVPVIVHTYHGHVFHSYFGKLKSQFFIEAERYLAKKSDHIIAISEIQKRELIDRYNICPESKMSIIPLGLDLKKFTLNRDAKRASFRKKYSIQDDDIAIGIVGRIVPIKNHAMFIDAIFKLLQKTTKKLKFIIVGDGEIRADLEAQLQDYGIAHNYYPNNENEATVIFTSWLINMDEVYAGLDIVALTSLNEGTPVSLIEAQAAGKPIVTTDVGGVRDVVLQHDTAIVTESGVTEQFSDALLQLTENDEYRTQLGIKGTDHVMALYDKSRLVTDMSQLYFRLLAAKGVQF